MVADRLGVLRGTQLSRVQWFAVQLLMAREMRSDIDKFVDSVKLALVAADPARYLHMVTGTQVPTDDVAELLTDEEFDSPGEWDFSNSDITPEMAMMILAEANTETTFTAHLPEKV